jgi:hypothetical protein
MTSLSGLLQEKQFKRCGREKWRLSASRQCASTSDRDKVPVISLKEIRESLNLYGLGTKYRPIIWGHLAA